MSSARPRELTGRHVLTMILAFFGVVVVANGVFIWLAIGSWTGLETENAYVEGLRYEEHLKRAEAQRALGWRLGHGWAGDAFEVRLRDAAAAPVGGVELTAAFRRPTHEGEDVRVILYPRQRGVFRSDPLRLAPGQWDLVILVSREGRTMFRRDDRIWVK